MQLVLRLFVWVSQHSIFIGEGGCVVGCVPRVRCLIGVCKLKADNQDSSNVKTNGARRPLHSFHS
jgi:hypothetical protein